MTTHVALNPSLSSPTETAGAPPMLDPSLMRVFSGPLRTALVSLLAGEQLCTCHLAHATAALPTAVSNHLRQLREAGLVETETIGRYTYYRLLPEPLERVAAQFAELAAAARTAAKRPC